MTRYGMKFHTLGNFRYGFSGNLLTSAQTSLINLDLVVSTYTACKSPQLCEEKNNKEKNNSRPNYEYTKRNYIFANLNVYKKT